MGVFERRCVSLEGQAAEMQHELAARQHTIQQQQRDLDMMTQEYASVHRSGWGSLFAFWIELSLPSLPDTCAQPVLETLVPCGHICLCLVVVVCRRLEEADAMRARVQV